MKKLVIFTLYWVPPLLIMITIFFLSSQERITVSSTPGINFSVFKTLHMIEYAVLYLFLFRAFRKTLKKKNQNKAYLFAMVIAILYGASDEIHQHFTPGREPTLRDVTFDTIGIYLMFQYTKNYLHHLKWFL